MNKDRQALVFQRFTFVVIAIFLILTAWGNAIALFAVSTIALIGLFLVRVGSRHAWSAAVFGAVVATVIAFGLT